jgi:hypothetical protein
MDINAGNSKAHKSAQKNVNTTASAFRQTGWHKIPKPAKATEIHRGWSEKRNILNPLKYGQLIERLKSRTAGKSVRAK